MSPSLCYMETLHLENKFQRYMYWMRENFPSCVSGHNCTAASARGSSLPFSLTRRSCPSSLPPSSKGFPGISTGATADEARHSSGQTALLVGSSHPHLDEGLHGLHHLTQQNRSFQTRLSAFQSNRISSFFQEH